MHVKADCSDPLVNQPCILARAEMAHIIDTAWEDEIVMLASPAVEPSKKSLARLGHDLELNGTLSFLLHDSRPISDRSTSNDVTDLQFHDVTTAQLAVDRQIKECPIPQSSMLVEKEPNCSNIARFEGTLCADHIASVPRTTPVCVRIKIRNSHVTTPLAGMAT